MVPFHALYGWKHNDVIWTSSLHHQSLLQRADRLKHRSGPLTSLIISSSLIHFSVPLSPISSSFRWFHFPSLLLAQFNFPLYHINVSVLSSSAINKAVSLLGIMENFGLKILVVFWELYTLCLKRQTDLKWQEKKKQKKRLYAHRVSQEVLCVPQSRPRLGLRVLATFVVGGSRRLSQIREVVSRPGASEADLVQAL